MGAQVSRRDFLLGSAVLGTGLLAAAPLAVGTQAAYAKEPDSVEEIDESIEPSEVYECDFCVCGSGTAGLCAANRAAELGAKVILVDVVSENGLGGNSRFV